MVTNSSLNDSGTGLDNSGHQGLRESNFHNEACCPRTFAMRLLSLRGIFFMSVVLLGRKMTKRERKYGLVKLCFHRWCASTVDIRVFRTLGKRAFLTWMVNYKFSKEVHHLSIRFRLGYIKVFGMSTASVCAGERPEWKHEVVSIKFFHERCKCGRGRRYCRYLPTKYKVPDSKKEMHRVCVNDVLAEEDIRRWKTDFVSLERNAWHDAGHVDSSS